MNAAQEFLVFCNPETPRAELFRAATARQGFRACLIPWLRVLRGEVPWDNLVGPQTILRIESPGKNWWVEKELLARGASEPDEEEACGWRRMSCAASVALENDHGRLWPLRQWFLGWRSVLQSLEQNLQASSQPLRWMNAPQDVLAMFDKLETQRRLAEAGVAVPQSLGLIRDFDDLMHRMREAGRFRVFLKPCHGSSACGVVALECKRADLQAWSTLALEGATGTLKLYNQRRVRFYRGAIEVAPLVNAVCRERALAQVWHPKPGWKEHRIDLRVLVIDGDARHVVPRLSRTPLTNLQLGSQRGDAAEIRSSMGEENWGRAMSVCESAAKAFPRSRYAGVDLLPGPEWAKPAVAELNAFGDFLPGCEEKGQGTYEAEIAAVKEDVQVSSAGL